MRTPTITVLLALFAGAVFAQESKGLALYKEGKFAEAANALKIEVDKDPTNETALVYLGLARVNSGNAAAAVEPLKKAVGQNEKNQQAHFGLGLAYLKLERLDEAMIALDKAWKLDSEDAYTHYYLGMTHNQKGQTNLAVRHLQRFVELAPNAPEAPAVRSFLSRF